MSPASRPLTRLVLLLASALASSPAVGAGLPAAGPGLLAAWPFDTAEPDRGAVSVTEILAESIAIPTVFPPGGEETLALRLVEHLERGDVEARVVDTPGQGRAAVWARVPGRGSAPGIVLLSHLDTVPAREEEWSVDPFAGVVRDGAVWGRGALDAKGVTAVHVATLLALARRDEPLERDVILLATPDEERGGVDGAGFVARERPDLLGDAGFLLTEGGGILLPAEPGGVPMWGVTVVEKSPCWLELSVRGRPGHSSAPGRDAAVPRLVAALDRVRRVETPIRVTPTVAAMFEATAERAPPEDRSGYANLEHALASDEGFRRRFLAQRGRNALVRNTISITLLEGGARTNVMPAVARAHLDVRLLPGERCDEFVRALEDVVADPDVEIRTLLEFVSSPSPRDTALFRAIEQVADEVDPGALVVPRAIGGFTDAHWFRDLGLVAYGFVPRWLAPGDVAGVHGVDERISIENLERGTATMLQILDRLDPP